MHVTDVDDDEDLPPQGPRFGGGTGSFFEPFNLDSDDDDDDETAGNPLRPAPYH